MPSSRMMSPRNWPDHGTNADHLWASRRIDVDSFCGSDDGCHPRPELLIFEECAHAPIYEKVEEFHQKTLAFLQRHAG
jgi:hypothetical protein